MKLRSPSCFASLLLLAFSRMPSVACLLSHAISHMPTSMTDPSALRVNGDRIRARLDAMAKIGRDPAGGVMRLAYSEADRQGCQLVEQWLREAGLEPSMDFGANIFGRRKNDRKGKPMLVGSHVDSVPNGGDFDGPLGVV